MTVSIEQDPRFQIPLYLALGIFCGLVIGLLGFNAANVFGPTTTEYATIRSVDVQVNRQSSTGTRTYYVEGDTESGRTWKFPSEDAYDLAIQGGYPMQASVTFSDITGSAVGLQVDDLDETLAGTANRIFFPLSTFFAVAVTMLSAWVMRKSGMVVVVSFVLGAIPIGTWLGYIAMRAWRGG